MAEKIKAEAENELKFYVYKKKTKGRTDGGLGFRADTDWFMSWDTEGRLWVYVPEVDQQYCRYWYANENFKGLRRVGEYGGLEGLCRVDEYGGWEGIRTPGTLQYASFQD